jgi:hypothetical protein
MNEKKQKSFAVNNKIHISGKLQRILVRMWTWHHRTLGVLTQLYKTEKQMEEVMSNVGLSPSTVNQRNTVY